MQKYFDIVNIVQTRIVQSAKNQKDKVYDVKVVSGGDPLEIYTDRDSEVIFKKYSPMGELSAFAAQMCETLNKTLNCSTVITDRDMVIAASGAARRDLMEKNLAPDLERIMDGRQIYQYRPGDPPVTVAEGVDKMYAGIAAPIISEGDVTGCMVLLLGDTNTALGDTEYKLAQTVSGFLGKQMES